MNLLLFSPKELQGDMLILEDRRAHHIIRVLKLGINHTVKLGMIDGPLGIGIICSVSADRVEIRVQLQDSIPSRPSIDLILALPRPIMLRRILKHAAVLGIDRLFLINSRRVEKSFFNASILQTDTIRALLIEGLEQAMDTLLPRVSIHNRFKPFIEDCVPEVHTPIKLVAHPGVSQNLPAQFPPDHHGQKVTIAIGPEGGWIDYEVEQFIRQGFHPFSMGPRILHVDTAVISLISQIQLLQSLKS